MDTAEISLRVRQLVGEVCDDLDVDLVHAEHNLHDNFGFDSFERVELLNSIEDEFGVTFAHPQDRDLTSSTTTVRDLLDAVQRQLSAKGISV